MSELNNPVEILKILNKDNCRQCGENTCLVFAVAVCQGKRTLNECPFVDPAISRHYKIPDPGKNVLEEDYQKTLASLKGEIQKIDLEKTAPKIIATFKNSRLTLKIMGKDFSVDAHGNMFSDIHVNPWVTGPVLTYLIKGVGKPLTGKWVSLRELEGGMALKGLFEQRCEKPLKKVADTYTDLFEDLILIFKGKKVENHYESDISLVLYPLPLVPILICYWKPEDGLASSLNIFFDESVRENLGTDMVYRMTTGLVAMFEKMAWHPA